MASGRSHISGALKAAVAASVLGIAGLMAAPSASASVLTVELVPTSATNGTISGQTVNITGPGTINFDIVAVLHSQDATQTNDGVTTLALSLQSDSPAVIGNLTSAYSAPFISSTGQNGTPTNPDGTVAPSGGPDIGPDRVGGPATPTGTTYLYAQANNSGSPILGTASTTGDLLQTIGVGSFTVTTLGSTNVVPVYHFDTSSFTPARTEKFQVDGVSFILNGDGHGTRSDTTGTITDPTLMNTQGFSVVAAPEPGSLALAGLGGLGLLLRRRRK